MPVLVVNGKADIIAYTINSLHLEQHLRFAAAIPSRPFQSFALLDGFQSPD